MSDDGAPIHGAMRPLGVPVLLEHRGRKVRVLEAKPRLDLKIAQWWQKEFRQYWECDLRTGLQRLSGGRGNVSPLQTLQRVPGDCRPAQREAFVSFVSAILGRIPNISEGEPCTMTVIPGVPTASTAS
jgi:hypothetical protein